MALLHSFFNACSPNYSAGLRVKIPVITLGEILKDIYTSNECYTNTYRLCVHIVYCLLYACMREFYSQLESFK